MTDVEPDEPYQPPRADVPPGPEELKGWFVVGFVAGLVATLALAAGVWFVPVDEANRELVWVSALGLAAILSPIVGVMTGMFVVRRQLSRRG